MTNDQIQIRCPHCHQPYVVAAGKECPVRISDAVDWRQTPQELEQDRIERYRRWLQAK